MKFTKRKKIWLRRLNGQFYSTQISTEQLWNLEIQTSALLTTVGEVRLGRLFCSHHGRRLVEGQQAIGVASSDGGYTRNWILGNSLQCFPSTTVLMSDGAYGADCQFVRSVLEYGGCSAAVLVERVWYPAMGDGKNTKKEMATVPGMVAEKQLEGE